MGRIGERGRSGSERATSGARRAAHRQAEQRVGEEGPTRAGGADEAGECVADIGNSMRALTTVKTMSKMLKMLRFFSSCATFRSSVSSALVVFSAGCSSEAE